MSAHDRNLIIMILVAAGLVSLNFFAIISGAAEAFYEPLTNLLQPLFMR